MNHDKIALVTGASRGIGKAIAIELAKEGYQIIAVCKNHFSELQAETATWTQTFKVPCKAMQCDVGNAAEVNALFDQIPDLDVLINNAGISYIGLTQDMTPSEWDHIIQTNLSSCFYTSRRAIPLFLSKKQGAIINISSIWGNSGASMEVAYSASKGGINAFTRALAKELAPSFIPVNAIACGVIDTEMNACFTQEEREALAGDIPCDRFGTPEEVAKSVASLLSMPSYMTGQIITIDGGFQ